MRLLARVVPALSLVTVAVSMWTLQIVFSGADNSDCKETCLRVHVESHEIDITSRARVQKYILLTTQRSGSTWVCELLDTQRGVTCGFHGASEMLIQYSRILKNRTIGLAWETYENDFLAAMQAVLSAALDGQKSKPTSHIAVGFKLMYNQIPYEFIENFIALLHAEKIVVLHLDRAATVMTLASSYNFFNQHSSLGKMHSTNASEIQLFRNTTRMPWTSRTIETIVSKEKEKAAWERTLRLSDQAIPVHYFIYEVLIWTKKIQIKQVMSFLMPEVHLELEDILENTTRLQLHEPLCSERIEDYASLREHPIYRDTYSAFACKLLEERTDVDGRTMSR